MSGEKWSRVELKRIDFKMDLGPIIGVTELLSARAAVYYRVERWPSALIAFDALAGASPQAVIARGLWRSELRRRRAFHSR